MKRHTIIAAVLAVSIAACAQNLRHETTLATGWRFTHTDMADQAKLEFDDALWERVAVPHDWAIAGPFDNNNDRQTVAIEQNGETIPSEKTGRTGSLPWTGVGWYRVHFKVNPKSAHAIINFDGAMSEPEVYINGRKAGEWKYGYNAFNIDATDFVNRDGSDNVLAVRLRNLAESSRWYPGAGLYRPVTLIQTGAAAVKSWGLNCYTESIDGNMAVLKAEADIYNEQGHLLSAEFRLLRGTKVVASASDLVKSDGKVYATLGVSNPRLWSPESPELYDLEVRVYDLANVKRVLCDVVTRRIGIRTVSYTAEHGFQLNGQTRKFKGVCLHHDLGMIGAAVNKAALVRQVELLKAMGCDAIRTAHNMPSQLQMDVCDSLGMMVMAESFDMWQYPKCRNGYNRFYADWWERDLTNLVMANRLHPSIVMWSVGNEIPEQGGREGTQMLVKMQDLMHRLDPTRLCTTGMDRWDNVITSGFADAIDIVGLNYRTHKYHGAYERLHQKFLLGSETASTVSSRGVYHFPVVRADGKRYDDGQCSSYDLEACSWSNIPEDDWVLQDDFDYVIGEFVWTGFDYLGEPTPYDDRQNARSSYFGIFDLAGLPKDRYYLYRSRWNTTGETIHLLPHWTWPGREGEVTPVFCYTNYPTAELFVNGKSQGRITKKTDVRQKADGGRTMQADEPLIDRYRLRWNDVKYEPGELRVVVYDADGKKRGEAVRHTAGAPHHIVLEPQTLDEYHQHATLKADGEDMMFFTVSVVDSEGNLCPEADNKIAIGVEGAAVFRGICNGDATSFEVFTNPEMHVFKGQLVVGIQSDGTRGRITVTVTSDGLPKAVCSTKAR
ncbi:MAG: DUF4982 domain-containing protein [Bacteroidaceae bacterium]|nr:DUF4982 domain-containing protein [Bacteroidaceae bacterium]